MKKILYTVVVAAAMLFATTNASAQIGHFGVLGGMTFSKAKDVNKEMMKNYTGFHVGVTYQLNLPLGFSIQPSLIYNVKGSKVGLPDVPDSPPADFTVGYLELPVSVQWGPDLLLFRPFLDVTPFVGYGLNNKLSSGDVVTRNSWSGNGVSRWEYGLGVGIGLEIWKFQVIGRYNWNFGSLVNFKEDLESGGAFDAVKNSFGRANFGGFTLTAAFLF